VAVPAIIAFGILAWFTQGNVVQLLLLLPGLIAMPVYALIPSLRGAVPLSQPTDEVKSAGRGLSMAGIILLSTIIAGIATLSWIEGFFWYFVAIELLVAICLYTAINSKLNRKRWAPVD
jgi:hypothetical protein